MNLSHISKNIQPKEVTKYLLALGVVVVISILSPRHVQFSYQFSEGQPWMYNHLYAEFDFGIQKTDEEYRVDTARITAGATTCYLLDSNVLNKAIRLFDEDFKIQENTARRDEQFTDIIQNPEKYRAYSLLLLSRFYNAGILEDSVASGNEDEDIITIISSGEPKNIVKKDLTTVSEVIDILRDTLPYSDLSEPEFIYPILEKAIFPNLFPNDSLSKVLRRSQIEQVSSATGIIKKGSLLVRKNDIISQDTYQKLISYQKQFEKVKSNSIAIGVFTGYFLLALMVVILYWLFLRFHYKPVFQLNWLIFLTSWIIIYCYLTYIMVHAENLSVYLIPFCITPIIVRHFYTERLALLTHLVNVILTSVIAGSGYDYILIQLLAGIVALIPQSDIRYWGNFFITILLIVLTYFLSWLSITLARGGLDSVLSFEILPWLALNGFLTLLAYPLIPLFAKLFGFNSSIVLVELSDLNHPLLKRLSTESPGTLQHSLQVANLSEAAVSAIGGDSLLVRVGAMYHDVGKILQPDYFIENQRGKNLHDELTPIDSAKIILSHVPDGIKLAKKSRLPKAIIRFIETHHGTTRVEYFYKKHCQLLHVDDTDDAGFRYKGPIPQSREECVLMIADALEATAKSLKNPNPEDIDNLIERIVNDKTRHGQFAQSMLTFDELGKCKIAFRNTLISMYHLRVEYPK
jgi:putative nucleotidyltransferase with HDIG domain